MKRLLILLICLSLVLCLVACGNKDNKDNGTNTNTDTSTNTDTATDTSTSTDTEVTYTVTAKDQDQNPVAGIVFATLDENDDVVNTYTTDENGVAIIVITNGTPNKLNVIDHPEHRSYQDGVITLGEETAIEISIKNTEPNGTQDRPYSIEDENEITILAGQTVYYVIYGGSNRNFNLSGANGIKLIFAGEEKAIKDDGSLSFKIPEVDNFNRVTELAFENTGDESVTFNLAITSDPGTSDNPFELELGKSYDEVIKKDQTIFYKWIADKTGYVVYYSESTNNSAMIYNQTSFVVTTPTNGALCDYIWVNEGDEIMFYVSSTNEENFNEVSFNVNCYAGTENDPIPVYEPAKMLSLKPSQALTFVSVCDGDCEVIIEGEGVKLIALGDLEFTPDQNGLISGWVIGNGVKFVVENTDTEAKQEFVISLEK